MPSSCSSTRFSTLLAAALAALAVACDGGAVVGAQGRPGGPGGPAGSGGSAAPRPDVLIVAFDGLGVHDIAGLAGGPTLAVTPGLDRLAVEGVVYLDAYASSPWAGETLGSALTGRLEHASAPGSTGPPTLAEHLAHLGYRTALLVAHERHLQGEAESREGARSVASGALGPSGPSGAAVLRGFEYVSAIPGAGSPAGARADVVAETAIEWLVSDSRPALLVVTLADPRPPHHLYDGLIPAADVPYDGPVLSGLDHAELLRRAPSFDDDARARLAELHASEVAMADRAFARMAGAAVQRRATPPVLVVLGLRQPALGERAGRYGLVPSLHPEDLRIPILIRLPVRPGEPVGAQSGDVHTPVTIADLTPTLLDALGFEPRRDTDGRSVLPGASLPERSVLAVTTRGVRSATLIGVDHAVQLSLDGRIEPFRRRARHGGDLEWERASAPDGRSLNRLTDWLLRSELPLPSERATLLSSRTGAAGSR